MEIKLGELSNNRVKQKIDMIEKQDISTNEIAIIGLACRFAQTDSQDEYWDAIKNGVDCIRTFPEERKRLNNSFLKYSLNYSENDEYYEGGFLNDVDKFDNDFFHVSPIEAKIMSPQQREFLQIAWSAIEDAGYGGKKIIDSNTGVFLGYSTDFGVSYKEYIDELNKDMEVLAVAGNLNSIVASRISYILNLKGPSMLIDTACSSSLVAVKTACDSILNGQCNMAIAGSIKLDLLPLVKIGKKEVEIGITSKEGRTRAFDNDSNGTGAGEGVAAILLKPLKAAVKDRDQIYAIIKGSAINQDGRSVNLTSPNPLAQEKVIIQAWKNANIDPKTISYIEAHGTGTRLGDPIEITGMNNAFRCYTTKQQFCGIGSVKTNIGHLDCAAGMASLIKLVLSLKYKVLPPSIHFKFPNQKIDFEESSLYVNDSLRPWIAEYYPRRGGVSAFGLSGTNCHIVLEESPVKREIVCDKASIRVATFSAKTQEALLKIIWQIGAHIRKHRDNSIDDVCYTLNTGRGQYEFKLAMIFQDMDDLFRKIDMVLLNGLSNYIEYDVFYGEHHIINSEQKKQIGSEITEWERNQLSTKVNEQIKAMINSKNEIDIDWLRDVCIHYCSGAEVMWEALYTNRYYQKVSLPTYPYARNSFWIEQAANIEDKTIKNNSMSYPLFKSCLAKSFDRITYESHFSPKEDWILSDHKVAGKYVVPGTTYLEMIRYVLYTFYQPKEIQLNNVFFLRPLILSEEESAKVHTIINTSGDAISFTIASKKDNDNEWVVHTEGQAEIIYQNHQQRLDLELIKGNMHKGELEEIPYEENEKIETGARWDNHKVIWIGEHEVLAKLSLKSEFQIEAKQFGMHPALLDEAANLLIRCIGNGLYLPYSYKGIRIKEHFSREIYTYVKEKKKKEEFALFDVIIMDDSGNVLTIIDDYMIRKVNTLELTKNFTDQTLFHHFIWKEKLKKIYSPMNVENCIVFVGKGKKNQEIAQYYEKAGCTLYNMPKTEVEFTRVLNMFDLSKNHKVLYLLPQFYQSEEQNNIEYRLANSLYQFQNFIFALNKSKLSARMELIVMGYCGVQINDKEIVIPEYAAVYSYVNGIRFEMPKINCYCIDLDEQIEPSILNLNEIDNMGEMFLSAFRNGKKYTRCLTQYRLDMLNKSNISIEKGHTYIITGGMGALGLACVKYIASKQQVRFVLVGRKGLRNTESNLQIKKLIEDIKETGSEIILENGDVSNLDFLDDLFEKVSNKYGQINGIFHLAGVAGDRFIKNKTEEEIDQVLLPKIKGTWNIDQLYDKYRIDFAVFFSSISSIVAEAGQVDYAAANGYMDGFAAYGRKKGRKYYSINWPAWSETGMAVQYGVNLEKQIVEPITTQNGFTSLGKILEREVTSVIVGKFNVNEYVENSTNLFDILPEYTVQNSKFSENS
ncbi:SDR family NAD(P)-dependent oxidoreductase [Anaerosporobacter sp.]